MKNNELNTKMLNDLNILCQIPFKIQDFVPGLEKVSDILQIDKNSLKIVAIKNNQQCTKTLNSL